MSTGIVGMVLGAAGAGISSVIAVADVTGVVTLSVDSTFIAAVSAGLVGVIGAIASVRDKNRRQAVELVLLTTKQSIFEQALKEAGIAVPVFPTVEDFAPTTNSLASRIAAALKQN
jgi:enoyl-CoA hydratase/carnithine racemase